MASFPSGTTVRVLQEDWVPFHNLHRTAQRFKDLTGITVEVTLSHIPEFWTLMDRAFNDEDPPFDLVGCDELLLLQYARAGRVEPLDPHVGAESYDLSDFEPAALDAVSLGGTLYGLPYCDVSSVLIYRRDLFDRYGIPVPQTMDALTQAALAIQTAVRADGVEDFYGITLRGAPSCGLNFWTLGSTWAPSWGVQWFDADGQPAFNTPEHRAALDHYIDLLHRAGPPESPTMGFEECMALYRAGRAAMVIEPANEASIVYDLGGPVADATQTALVPAGPKGTRHAGLYCPPYAIPAQSRVKAAAWELAKFLCAPEQLIDDAQRSGFVEVSRRSVLSDPRFVARFRPDLVESTRATRAFARGERPVIAESFAFGDILGEECARALAGEQTAQAALDRAESRVRAMGITG
ncbi:MAG: sugar ABC transporter substrate-binding protein [Chloroflexi bacterium]|nr:sugar ABC transporter substrate-binding protein [Chloroflexota bacterium]